MQTQPTYTRADILGQTLNNLFVLLEGEQALVAHEEAPVRIVAAPPPTTEDDAKRTGNYGDERKVAGPPDDERVAQALMRIDALNAMLGAIQAQEDARAKFNRALEVTKKLYTAWQQTQAQQIEAAGTLNSQYDDEVIRIPPGANSTPIFLESEDSPPPLASEGDAAPS